MTLPVTVHNGSSDVPSVCHRLLIACSAVVSGARSFVAIGQWAANAPQDALARLGARTVTAFGLRVAPSGAAIRRLIIRTCPGGLADLLGHDPAGAGQLAVDGKTARGSRTGDSPAAHLLAAITNPGQTVTQVRVPDKINEIACFAALLQPYDLTGVTVTADALHTQRDHARYLFEEKKAHYAFTVKLLMRAVQLSGPTSMELLEPGPQVQSALRRTVLCVRDPSGARQTVARRLARRRASVATDSAA